MKWLLDTDTCIDILRRREPVLSRFAAAKRTDIAVSAISEGELRTGAGRSSKPSETTAAVENFLRPLRVLSFSPPDASVYAGIRVYLEDLGAPIGPLDTLIGAQAVSRGLILVTSNRREFSRIPGIQMQDWREAGGSKPLQIRERLERRSVVQ